jgi:hypothetical protein
MYSKKAHTLFSYEKKGIKAQRLIAADRKCNKWDNKDT